MSIFIHSNNIAMWVCWCTFEALETGVDFEEKQLAVWLRKLLSRGSVTSELNVLN